MTTETTTQETTPGPSEPAAEPTFHDQVMAAAREAREADGAAAPPTPEADKAATPPEKAEPEAEKAEKPPEGEPKPEKEPEKPAETAKEGEKAELDPTEPEEPTSRALATLARKERKLLEREKSVKELEQRAQAFERAMGEAKQNPLALLEAAGLSVADLTHYLVEGKPPEPKPEDRIAQLEAKIEAMQRQRLEQEQAATQGERQRLLADFTAQLTTHVESNAEKYPLVKRNDAAGVVLQVIQQHAAETGRILSNDEACLLVEQELSNIGGLSGGSTSTPAEPAKTKGSSAPQENPKAPATLSNELQAGATGKESRELTDEEREANAMRLLRQSPLFQR